MTKRATAGASRRKQAALRRELSARVLVSAVGVLNRPKLPDIDGLALVHRGPPSIPRNGTAYFDWRGKRVAMIGTGASGHQVGPSIAPDVNRLTIFQRSPHWVVPNPNYHEGVSDGKKWALANIPFYLRWYRFQLFWGFADGLHEALKVDPEWPVAKALAQRAERKASPVHGTAHAQRTRPTGLTCSQKSFRTIRPMASAS